MVSLSVISALGRLMQEDLYCIQGQPGLGSKARARLDYEGDHLKKRNKKKRKQHSSRDLITERV